MLEKKLYEGHSEQEALKLPTTERLAEMRLWLAGGRPPAYIFS